MDFIRELGSILINLLYLALIVIMILNRRYLGKYVGIVILALTVTFLTEMTTVILPLVDEVRNTVSFYVVGILGVVYFLFLFYFYKLMQNPVLKRIQLGIVACHVLNFSISAVIIDSFFAAFPEITNFISIFLILVSLFVFLNDTFNSDKVLRIKGFFPFFVAVSLTFIYVGLVPILFFSNRIMLETEKLIFFIMLFTVNMIGYSIMLAGIFFAKIQKKGII